MRFKIYCCSNGVCAISWHVGSSGLHPVIVYVVLFGMVAEGYCRSVVKILYSLVCISVICQSVSEYSQTLFDVCCLVVC